MKRISFSVAFILVCFVNVNAQNWIEGMKNPNANFYETQKLFNEYWGKQDPKIVSNPAIKKPGFNQFKRWENFMEPRVYPSGDITIPSKAFQEYYNTLSSTANNKITATANWSMAGNTNGEAAGMGRLSCVRWMPNDTSVVFAGAASGGLWKSINGGITWTTNTDQLASIAVNDIAINPLNTNIMYLASGDRNKGLTVANGVYKSTDGGATWGSTGINYQWWTANRLLINPINPNTIFACIGYSGIYRSTNAGLTWTQVLVGGQYYDIEYKPNDTTTIYAAGDKVVRSTDGGASFTQLTTGLPSTNVLRIALAVTPADPNYVYVLVAGSSPGYGGLEGFYQSTDAGNTFSSKIVSPSTTNILGYGNLGTAGGQGYYDLAIAVSPTDKNIVYVGGVNIFKTTDGGVTWSMKGYWGGTPNFHADVHDLRFPLNSNGNLLFTCTDGGLHKTINAGDTWIDLSLGLQIGQIYKMGASETDPTMFVTGRQDNGSRLITNNGWTYIQGGDGMDCLIDWSNDSISYATSQYAYYLYRSSDRGASVQWLACPSEGGLWVTPYVQSPINPKTIYMARNTNVWKSMDRGATWNQLGSMAGSTAQNKELAVAPSDTNYIYVVKYNEVWGTKDGGATWNNITGALPVTIALPTNVAVDPVDPKKVYITCSGYYAVEKVYYSSDAGTTWTNITATGLPNLPVNCIILQQGTANGMYIGTDVGVYYKDDNTNGWIPFNTGLPNVIVTELEIFYPTNKLRAATYGRGLWETDLYAPGVKPTPQFTANQTTGCSGTVVQFADNSTGWPTKWRWEFQGGSPTTANTKNPTITYNSTGTFLVKLVAMNKNGRDSLTLNSYITIINGTTPQPIAETFSGSITPTGWSIVNPNNDITWQKNTSVGGFGLTTDCAYFDNYTTNVSGTKDRLLTAQYDFSQAVISTLKFDVAAAQKNTTTNDSLIVYYSEDCGITFKKLYAKAGANLATAAVSASKFVPASNEWRTEIIDISILAGKASVLFAFENKSDFGNVIYLDNINISSSLVGINEASNWTNSITVFPNPTHGNINIVADFTEKSNYSIEISNAIGQIVYQDNLQGFQGRYSQNVKSNNLAKGVYYLKIKNENRSANKEIIIY